MLKIIFAALRRHGPLGAAWRANTVLSERFGSITGFMHICRLTKSLICIMQQHFERRFDLKYGTDTSGVIPLKDLNIRGKNAADGIWYEPMSIKAFRQIMNHLTINFRKFIFVDMGSGKGRVLLMAANYGFKKIIGVEFAENLHRIACENVAIYRRHMKDEIIIETVCMDATEFPLPTLPLVIFFYSPFRGKVMEQVLSNIHESWDKVPRELILLFYGSNPDTINRIKSTYFCWRELPLRADWSRLTQYRAFLISSQNVQGRFQDTWKNGVGE